MRTEQLHYLIALQKYPSFNSAAAHLHISFQALFRSINNLEEELDLILVERTPRGVTLTEDGKRLITASQSLFSEIEDMQQKRKSETTLDPITIPTTQTVVADIFKDFLVTAYRKHWPIRMIELAYHDIFNALLDKRYRLAISHQTYLGEACLNPLPDEFTSKPIFKMEHVLMASKKFKLHDKGPIDLAALKDYPFAVYKCQDKEAFLLQILLKYIPPDNIIVEENPFIFDQLLLEGIAIGYGSLPILREKHMRAIPLTENSSSTYCFIWLKDTLLRPQELQAIDIISQYIEESELVLKQQTPRI